MRARFRALILALCCTAACGCAGGQEIRVANASSRDYFNVRIADQEFGNIAAGETSKYRKVHRRLGYASMEMRVDGRRITGQTLNYGTGRYTHRIDVIDLAKGRLDIKIVRD